MSENAINKKVRDDEIDLLDLFGRIGREINRWVCALGRAFLTTSIFLLKRWLPLGLSLVAGIGVSLLLKIASPSFYKSDLVLKNNTISNADMISYLNRLHTYCKEKNRNALSEAISVTSQQVNNIIDISAFWIIDKGNDGMSDFVDYKNKHNIYDTLNIRMQDRLDIRVMIRVPSELNIVRNGIINYINTDSLFQQRNRVRLRQNKEILTRLNYDILQLDSLQKLKYFEVTRNMQPKNGGQMIFLQEHNTQLVYNEIYSLYTRKQALETERELYKDITTILSEFSIPAKRVNGGSYYAFRVVPSFFVLTLLILIILANRIKLNEVYRKY
jgi:hypothetical protein